MTGIKKCSECGQERETIALVDERNVCLPCNRIENISDRVKILENKRTENCPYYVTGCFHVLEQMKIIQQEKENNLHLTRQKDEFYAKWKERTEDAKCYMERNKEALKIYEKFLNSNDDDAINCIGNMVSKLKGE